MNSVQFNRTTGDKRVVKIEILKGCRSCTSNP